MTTLSVLRGDLKHSRSPTGQGVIEAARRLSKRLVETPVLESSELNRRMDGRVLLKAENLQRGGAFKYRGAFNRLYQLTRAERRCGVVAYSSGNHAIGVAIAANELGIPATLVMPRDAPRVKIQRVRAYDADIIFYDRLRDSREDLATTFARERGALVVPSFDDPWVIEGQGTAALELIRYTRRRAIKVDSFVCPAGGGGLLAGCALAFAHQSPETIMIAAEPVGFDDIARSIASRVRQSNELRDGSVCDALLVASSGELTFPVLLDHVSHGVAVTDIEVLVAVAYAWDVLKLVIEPSGAVGLAALLAGKIESRGKTIATILSGGNVDFSVIAESRPPTGVPP